MSIFGGNTGITYEQLQQRRKLADQLRGQNAEVPRNVGEGIHAIAKALVARGVDKQNVQREKEMRDQYANLLSGIYGGTTVGGYDAGYVPPPAPEPGVADAFPQGRDAGQQSPAAARMVTAGGEQWDPGTTDPWAGQEHIKAGIFAGESGGDYDAVFGFQNRPGGKFANVKPTNMTVAEVLQFQDPQGEYGQWVKGQVGRVATPVGAYQIVGKTLRDAVASGVVSPDEPFDQATQDRVGKWVLSTQGTGAWEGYRGPQTGGVRTAQAGGISPSIAQLAQILSAPDEFVPAGQKAVAQALLQQQIQAGQPSPFDQRATVAQQYGIAPGTPEYQQFVLTGDLPSEPSMTSTQREYQQAVQQGYQGSIMDYKRDIAEAGRASTSVNVNTGQPAGEGADVEELRKKLGGKEGELWSTYLDQGSVSAGTVADMELLDELITLAPQGPLQGRFAEMFPGFNSAASAFQSVVKRVAPTLRAPGSGSTSDIEYDGMLKSLPQLSARPEANRAIAAMMKAKSQINIERADVVRAFQNGEITSQDARSRIQEIDKRSIMTPELRAVIRGTGEAPPPAAEGSGLTFEQFSADPSAQSAAEKYGVTLEEMWEVKNRGGQ